MDRSTQADQLAADGLGMAEIDELLRYNEKLFTAGEKEHALEVPLPDEPFVACWERWAEEAASEGVFAVLRRHLPQLRFPIRAGISRSEPYRDATLRGVDPAEIPAATGLELEHPEALELVLHPSFAGRVPVIVARHRPDFITLLQALARRNEPQPVSDAQGALMLVGYNNWQRIAEHRRRFEAQDEKTRESASWSEEFARLKPRKELYQDRFILLSDGPYSAVEAACLGLGEQCWRELSLTIRREHECTHYYTRRLYGVMRNHLLDELIADYTGIVAAFGRFRADWFLRFIGLENADRYRAGARLDLYRGEPPLSDGAFRGLHRVVVEAAHALERFDARFKGPRSVADRAGMVRALASLSLVELAAADAEERLAAAWAASRPRSAILLS